MAFHTYKFKYSHSFCILTFAEIATSMQIYNFNKVLENRTLVDTPSATMQVRLIKNTIRKRGTCRGKSFDKVKLVLPFSFDCVDDIVVHLLTGEGVVV